MVLKSFKINFMKIVGSALGFKGIDPTSHEVSLSTANRKRIQLADQNLPKHSKKYLPEPGDIEVFSKIDAVIKYTLRRYAKLAKEHNFVLLVLDEAGAHKPYLDNAEKDFGISIIHIGPSMFKKSLLNPGLKLPKELRIEGDGHFNFEANRLLANMITNALINNSILPTIKSN